MRDLPAELKNEIRARFNPIFDTCTHHGIEWCGDDCVTVTYTQELPIEAAKKGIYGKTDKGWQSTCIRLNSDNKTYTAECKYVFTHKELLRKYKLKQL